MGRAQLVNFVINEMLLYSFHIYHWRQALLKEVDRCIRNFIWEGDPDQRKLVTVSQKNVCKPLVEGGLGVRAISMLSEAATLKLCLNFVHSNVKCVVFLRARFLRHKHHLSSFKKSSLQLVFKCHFHLVASYTGWNIGSGSNANFQNNCWCLNVSISDCVGVPSKERLLLSSSVQDFYSPLGWLIPSELFVAA